MFAMFLSHAGHATGALGGGASFAAGLAHPLTGADHLLAMTAVGAWAAQLGGRARWVVPLAFVVAMAGGGAIAAARVELDFAEAGVAASILGLGALMAAAVRVRVAVAALVAGLFAVCHGHAHVAEMPPGGTPLAYGAGFLAATVALHAAGFSLAAALRSMRLPGVARVAGGVLALVGVAVWIGGR
jgi:urease accessory protein